jgi:hypothetical protein
MQRLSEATDIYIGGRLEVFRLFFAFPGNASVFRTKNFQSNFNLFRKVHYDQRPRHMPDAADRPRMSSPTTLYLGSVILSTHSGRSSRPDADDPKTFEI